jgi:hypothetical protein
VVYTCAYKSDVVLLVLNIWDLAGCCSQLVEEEVQRHKVEGKCLIFVLNKIGMYASP